MLTRTYHLLCTDRNNMPKKTRPITVLTEEELNALDDATFAELAADKERFHQALQNPATIRSGQALSIAKTKPRRKTAPCQQSILDSILNRDDEDYIEPLGRGTGITSMHDQVSVQGTVI